MTGADLVVRNARVHTLATDDPASPTGSAIAIRDGVIDAVGPTYDIDFRVDVDTEVIDLDGHTVLPGFIDAHTHLELLGRQQIEADLTEASSPGACLERLRARRDETSGWVLGYGYDESSWREPRYLTRADLDTVSSERPVVALREDLHLASVNSVVLDRFADELPESDVRTAGGDPTGVLIEDAVDVLRRELRPDPARTREYLTAGQAVAISRGVTTIHDMVRNSHAPRVYRQLDIDGELLLRVRLNYWVDHLDAIEELGLRTNHGSSRVRMGAIKCLADGSIGSRTARLQEPYADSTSDERGDWVTEPDRLDAIVDRVDEAGLQMAVHAIGDEAIDATLGAFDGTEGRRHRIEHAELLTPDQIERIQDEKLVVSAQPNFLKWTGDDGLYENRLGPQRTDQSNPFAALVSAGIPLAFGSDCMPLDPLMGIEQAVTARSPHQRLDVGAAISAYTRGGAYAGFDEERLGTLEPGTCADIVVLEDSPWSFDGSLAELSVTHTIVDGEVVYQMEN